MTGALDAGFEFRDAHPAVLRAQRNHPQVRFGASNMLYHELVPTILGQRVTAGEAIRQWHTLCYRLGEPAPGPAEGLLLPPSPAAARRSSGVVVPPLRNRGQTRPGAAHRRQARRQAVGMGAAVDRGGPRQVGAASRCRPVDHRLGDGLGNGRPRCSGSRRFSSEEPGRPTHSAGNRGAPTNGCSSCSRRTPANAAGSCGCCNSTGHSPPAFGPRQRILPMARW